MKVDIIDHLYTDDTEIIISRNEYCDGIVIIILKVYKDNSIDIELFNHVSVDKEGLSQSGYDSLHMDSIHDFILEVEEWHDKISQTIHNIGIHDTAPREDIYTIIKMILAQLSQSRFYIRYIDM